jgi:hypothetical protein
MYQSVLTLTITIQVFFLFLAPFSAARFIPDIYTFETTKNNTLMDFVAFLSFTSMSLYFDYFGYPCFCSPSPFLLFKYRSGGGIGLEEEVNGCTSQHDSD